MRARRTGLALLALLWLLAPAPSWAEDETDVLVPEGEPESLARDVSFTWAPQSPTLAVAFSPDGRLVATGRENGRVVLWDVARERVLRALDGRSDAVASVAFSPDGRLLRQKTARPSSGTWAAGRCGGSTPTPRRLTRWRSARTGGWLPPAPGTKPPPCGTWPVSVRYAASPATRRACPRWRSARTDGCSPRALPTRRRGSGTWRPAPRCAPCGFPMPRRPRFSRWRSARMGDGSPRAPRTSW